MILNHHGRRASMDEVAASDEYGALILSRNPVCYYRMNEVSNGTLYDSSGNGNDVTLAGATDFEEPPLIQSGSSIKLAGFNANTVGGNVPSLPTGGSARSVEFWFKTTAWQNNQFYAGADNNGNNYFHLTMHASLSRLYVHRGSGDYIVKTGTLFSIGNVYHMVLTYDGAGRTKAYRNGVLEINALFSFSDTDTTYINFGGLNSVELTGWADEYAFYDYDLSQAEVTASYDTGTGA